MANLEKVIRINETDYGTLVGGGTITKDGVEYEYDDSALYVIENPSPPAYALTAGQANTAVKDVLGRNIVDTYLTEADVPSVSSSTPLMDGTASVGSSPYYARGDHRHPTDTSRQATLVSGTNIKTVDGISILGSGNLVTVHPNTFTEAEIDLVFTGYTIAPSGGGSND